MQALVHNGLNTHTRAAHKAMTYQLAVRAFSGYAFCVLLSFVMLNATRAGGCQGGCQGRESGK